MNKKITYIQKLIFTLGRLEYKRKKCFYGDCDKRPINSHTIAKKYLKVLNKDLKKIITFQPDLLSLFNKQNPVRIRAVDQDKFSTFTGFCSIHDNCLFKLIDNFDGKMTKKKATLIHYRNICYGINHIKTCQQQEAHILKQDYIKDNAADLEPTKMVERLNDDRFATRLACCLKEHLSRKKQLEDMIKSNNFDEIDFIELLGNLEYPILCGRTRYPLQPKHKIFEYPGYNYMPWITYMTLLSGTKNHLIFCWLKSDKKYAKYLKDLEKEAPSKIAVIAYASSDAFAVEESFHGKHTSAIESLITCLWERPSKIL